MTKRLIIVGAGGFGREVYSYALYIQSLKNEWEIVGFIDDNPEALKGYNYPVTIIGTILNYQPRKEDVFTMAIGLPTGQKMSVAQSLMERGAHFISLIHPSSGQSFNSHLGRGCVMGPWSGVSCDTQLGDFVTINAYASVGHDSVIEEGCTISSYGSIAGNVRLERGVSVGLHACVLPGVEIGEFATVGAGSVVIKSVKPNTTVMGVPAKKIY